MCVYDIQLSTICQTPKILSRQRCTQNFEVEVMGEGDDPGEENLAEEASVKSTVSISRWPLITTGQPDIWSILTLPGLLHCPSSAASLSTQGRTASKTSTTTKTDQVRAVRRRQQRLHCRLTRPCWTRWILRKVLDCFPNWWQHNQYNYVFVEKGNL